MVHRNPHAGHRAVARIVAGSWFRGAAGWMPREVLNIPSPRPKPGARCWIQVDSGLHRNDESGLRQGFPGRPRGHAALCLPCILGPPAILSTKGIHLLALADEMLLVEP